MFAINPSEETITTKTENSMTAVFVTYVSYVLYLRICLCISVVSGIPVHEYSVTSVIVALAYLAYTNERAHAILSPKCQNCAVAFVLSASPARFCFGTTNTEINTLSVSFIAPRLKHVRRIRSCCY